MDHSANIPAVLLMHQRKEKDVEVSVIVKLMGVYEVV